MARNRYKHNMKRKRKIIPFTLLTILILFIVAGVNPFIKITEYRYESTGVPAAFDQFKICLISDLHCKSFGKDNQTLLKKIDSMAPDIVVLTGDIVDESHSDLSSVEALFSGLKQRNIPAYYVTGNHELEPDASLQYAQLITLMNTYGVTDLDDKTEEITRGDASIYLTGSKWYSRYVVDYLPPADPQDFTLLLYHGADLFDLVSEFNYDLVLAGHVHGGIVRIPFANIGLFGNSGELFPKYTCGIYQNDSKTCTMIASSGLGDSIFPRFYNRPELVGITLHSLQP